MATDFIVSADTSPAIIALEKLSNKLSQVSDNFKDKFGKMAGYTGKLQAALLAAGTAVAAYADDISDVADANQVAIEQVLGLGKALEQSGGKADTVGRMFQAMSNNIEEANAGNLKTANTFQRLGVSIDDLGNLSNTALKDKLLDGLTKIKDPIEKNALAMQVFGKSMVGVDIDKFAQSQRQAVNDSKPYADSIKTAGEAWDNMAVIMGKLKLAFAEAFQPVFWLISKLSVNVDALAISFRLIGAALIVMTGATILGGMSKLIQLVKELNIVSVRNPFIAIATGLLAIAPMVADYLNIGGDVKDQQSENNDEILKGVRNQQGLNDAIKKEKDSLSQIRETLEKNWKVSLDKYDLELSTLGLSEDQKKVAQDLAKIDEDAYNAKFSLQQKFEAMDTDARTRNLKGYEAEQAAIQQTADAQKKAVEAKIKSSQDYAAMLKNFQAVFQTYADSEQKMFEAEAKRRIDNSGYKEKIDLETKLELISSRRAALMGNLSKISETEKQGAIQSIDEITNNVDLLNLSHIQVGMTMRKNLDSLVEQGKISEETARILTQGVTFGTAGQASEALSGKLKEIADQSRTFSSGWNRAFTEYVDNATNAATQAQRVFQAMTQGMEDLLMNFFKTGKFEWKNFVNSIVEIMLRSQIQQLMANVMTTGSSGGSILGGLGKLLGFAGGGMIPTNGPVLVGERGPEIISGALGRNVTPNGSIGGSNVTYNINAVDAQSFKQMIARDPSFIHAVAMQGAKTIPGRA